MNASENIKENTNISDVSDVEIASTDTNGIVQEELTPLDDTSAKKPNKVKKALSSMGQWLKNHAPSKRRIIQVYAMLLYNCNFKGFKTGEIFKGDSKAMCVPGLNCYSCPGAVGACPLGSLQNALANSGTRLPFYVIGIIVMFGLLLGRTICGWLCPMGLIQELLHKIKTPKIEKSKVTRVLSYFKYVLLVIFVITIPIMYQTGVPAFCKYICTSGTLLGGIMLLVNPSNADQFADLGPLFTWKFLVLILVVVGSVFIYRIFCRFLCPLGAIYGFFSKIALLGVKLDKNKCTECGLCVSVCKMDIKHVGDHECIQCGACVSVCPVNAISWKGSKIFLRQNETDMPVASEKVDLIAMANNLKAKTNNDETSLNSGEKEA